MLGTVEVYHPKMLIMVCIRNVARLRVLGPIFNVMSKPPSGESSLTALCSTTQRRTKNTTAQDKPNPPHPRESDDGSVELYELRGGFNGEKLGNRPESVPTHHDCPNSRLLSDRIPTRLNHVAVCDANNVTNPDDYNAQSGPSISTCTTSNTMYTSQDRTSKSPFLSLIQEKAMSSRGQTVFGNVPCYIRQTSPLLTGVSYQHVRSIPRSMPGSSSENRNMSVGPSRDYSTSPTLPAMKRAKTDVIEKDLHSVDEYLVPQLDPTHKEEDTFEMYDMRMFPREWEYTEYGRAHSLRPKEGVEFTVLSYNVLSQSLLEDNVFLYPYCPPEVLNWSYRKTRLLEELNSYQPTVLCLQEVESAHYTEFFLPELEARGYEGTFQKRTGSKPDGCAIFVRSDKFKISEVQPISYCRGGLLDRDNVALVTKLTSVHPNTMQRDLDLYVATTHLLFNPRRGDVKLAQLSVLFAELDKIASCETDVSCGTCSSDNQRSQSPSYAPVIVCGDFNMEPHSDMYKFIVQGYLHYEGLLCRELSGQREYRHGRDVYLPNCLLPAELGITDQCQYVSSLHERKVPVPDHIGKVSEQASRDSDESVSDGNRSSSARRSHHHAPLVSQGTGYLWHKLNFVSVYKHTIERLGHNQPEVTTKHDYASCTVDYIFYNVRRKNTHTKRNRIVTRDVEEDKLRLLARYGLLSSGELRQVGGLPNRNLASDHLGLLAKFLLKSE